MNIKSYSVNLISQGNNRFYSLTMPSEVLGKCCFVTTRDEDPKQGFQRTLDEKRAREIAEYIDLRHGSIPSAIILSAQPEAQLKIVNKGKTLQFVDNPRAFLVLDGQHRVWGFSFAKSSIRVPVIIYNGLTRKDESRIFIDINTKQKPVPNELLLDIKRLADYESSTEQVLNNIFTLFHEEPSSPLIGLTASAARTSKKISRVTFNSAFRPIIKIFGTREAEEIFEIVSMYLRSFYKALATKNLEAQITNPTVFKSIISLFPVVAAKVKDRQGGYFEDGFDNLLFPLIEKVREGKIKKPSTSYKELTEYFQGFLESNFTL